MSFIAVMRYKRFEREALNFANDFIQAHGKTFKFGRWVFFLLVLITGPFLLINSLPTYIEIVVLYLDNLSLRARIYVLEKVLGEELVNSIDEDEEKDTVL
ncbi:hypothetical protein [Phaeocystidibacter luteus]|uniref:Uncharacterized protein n=1 Tax=Phaeocystidibacter luteus TaxID=911197 RepID=A0A6N6RLY9_9FLAO|nr:hypothetical protein [Phaeocystidibacter luteus]KAB2814580.1 hypothetical protein F8C67_02235 [Phaeocystidibacter luteus]